MADQIVGAILIGGGVAEIMACAIKEDLDHFARCHYTLNGLCFLFMGICRLI